jgi:DNA-binding protein Fis
MVTALQRCDSNRTLAARRLGIARDTLIRKLKPYSRRDRTPHR